MFFGKPIPWSSFFRTQIHFIKTFPSYFLIFGFSFYPFSLVEQWLNIQSIEKNSFGLIILTLVTLFLSTFISVVFSKILKNLSLNSIQPLGKKECIHALQVFVPLSILAVRCIFILFFWIILLGVMISFSFSYQAPQYPVNIILGLIGGIPLSSIIFYYSFKYDLAFKYLILKDYEHWMPLSEPLQWAKTVLKTYRFSLLILALVITLHPWIFFICFQSLQWFQLTEALSLRFFLGLLTTSLHFMFETYWIITTLWLMEKLPFE